MQIFKKHAELTYLFIWKTMLVSYSPFENPGPNVGLCFGLWDPPTASLPIVFRHPGLPVGVKHDVFHFSHRHVHSFLLVSLIWQPVYASSLRRRVQYPLQYFEFGLSILHTAPLNIGDTECFYCILSARSEAQVIYCIGKRATASQVAATFIFIIRILQKFTMKWLFCSLEDIIINK